MKRWVLLGVLAFSHSTWALDMDACSKLMNNGWYKKYEYGGVDQPLTKATKKHGSSKGTSATSTEGSTASVDPGYTTNVYTSHTQFTSSWGACDSIGLQRVEEAREKYYSQNKSEILKQMARGEGEHLAVLASFSLCDSDARAPLALQFQKNIQRFADLSGNSYGAVVDSIIVSDSALATRCMSL